MLKMYCTQQYSMCHDMQPFHPLLKLILIKAVIFLTFWQVRPIELLRE